MEMKINLDQLFSVSADINTTSISRQSEDIRSLNDSIRSYDQKYKLNIKIFDNDEDESNLFKEISDIETPNNYSNKSVKNSSTSQKGKTRQPGERLFYESQMNEMRKMKEKEKVMQEAQAEFEKQTKKISFINEKSKEIIEKKKIQNKHLETKKKGEKIPPTTCRKEIQELQQCTFKPVLNAKSSEICEKIQHSQKSNKFDELYYDHKMKEMRKRLHQAQLSLQKHQSKKVMSKHQIDQFIQRHQEYAVKINKKHQMLKNASQLYDLKSGSKLYSPKLIQSKGSTVRSSKELNYAKKSNFQETPSPKEKEEKDHLEKSAPLSGIFNKKKHLNEDIHFFQSAKTQDNSAKPSLVSGNMHIREQEEQLDEKYEEYSKQFDHSYGNNFNNKKSNEYDSQAFDLKIENPQVQTAQQQPIQNQVHDQMPKAPQFQHISPNADIQEDSFEGSQHSNIVMNIIKSLAEKSNQDDQEQN